MSKKMMKRSLALGALMAFVITGSAWAANYTEDDIEYGYLGPNETGNIVTISDSYTFEGDELYIAGGCGNDVTNNVVNLSGTFNYDGTTGKPIQIYGGDGFVSSAVIDEVGIAKNNTVNILGGLIGEAFEVAGGAATHVAENNAVNISGGTVKGNVFGASWSGSGSVSQSLMFKNNSINIFGNADVQEAGLYGYKEANGEVVEASGNALNIKGGWSGTIGSAKNFNAINIIEGAKATFKTALDDANVAVNVKGATWNVDKANTVGSAYFDATSTLKIDGATFANNNGENSNYALNGNGNGTLTVEQGAKLKIEGIKETTYNIAQNFTNLKEAAGKWEVSDINTLMQGVAWTSEEGLQVEVLAKKAEDIAEDMGVSVNVANTMTDIITAANENKNIKPGTPQAGVVEFANALADAAPEVAGQAVEAVVKMAEEVGQSAIAASIVKNVTDITNDRLSFNCGHSAPQKGGYGVGLLEEGSGADVWVEYVHGKDEVENMKSTAGATSYEGQYNGFVMGVDFKKVHKFQSGIAFNYGEGDTNSVGSLTRTHSDYDFWGIGYYGNIHNDDSNVIFDINYAKTDSDVTQKNLTDDIEASPEATTWTAGVKVEKLYQNENVRIVPYTGLRYMSIDADDYSTKCGTYNYKMERKDIWLLPVGVSIKQEVANDNGWTVSPRVDLSYIWAFGDTDSNMGFGHALDNKITNIGYDVMDDGSFLGLVGIEAHKGQWGYGVAYSYQKGDHSESKKWYVDVNYSF